MSQTEVFDLFRALPPEFEVDLVGASALDREAQGRRPVRYYRHLSTREALGITPVLTHADLARDEVRRYSYPPGAKEDPEKLPAE